MKALDKINAALNSANNTKIELDKFIESMKQSLSASSGTIRSPQLHGLGGTPFGPAPGQLMYPSIQPSQTTYTTIGHSASQPTLSAAEELELEHLVKERERVEKSKKMEVFKALPREFRQSILNILIWEDAVHEMDAVVDHTQSVREAELSSRRLYSGHSLLGRHTHLGYRGLSQSFDTDARLRTGIMLPAGITKEDLLAAHMDASLEEEIGVE